MRSTHSQRLERYCGSARLENLSKQMRGWYGPPIHLVGAPGNILIGGDGDFVGRFDYGFCASAYDVAVDVVHRLRRGRVSHGTLNVGFASIADYMARVLQGHAQRIPFAKGLSNSSGGDIMSMWTVGINPPVGAVSAAAPGGRALDNTISGTLRQADAASGCTLHLTGVDAFFGTAQVNISVLLYDRLFDVAKNMAVTTTETVTGVPTRYQSTTPANEDYIAGNFIIIETTVTLAGSPAHSWTVNLYTNQAGTGGQTLPTVIGIVSTGAGKCITQASVGQWFLPLAAGDVGVKDITQLQYSAVLATGAINFVIGHPIAWMLFPINAQVFQFDFIQSRKPAPRIFDGAALTMLYCTAGSFTTPPFGGVFEFTETAP